MSCAATVGSASRRSSFPTGSVPKKLCLFPFFYSFRDFFVLYNKDLTDFSVRSFMRMPLAGLEPARIAPLDFESSASANSATAA